MSLQVTGAGAGSVGRMLARRTLPEAYAKRQSGGGESAAETAATLDVVSLSAAVPKPFASADMEDAMATAKTAADGGRLSGTESGKLREDRVFAALTYLLAMDYNGEGQVPGWPGGLPSPTAEEMRAAQRRLSQRLTVPDSDDEGAREAVRERERLLDRLKSPGTAGLTQAANTGIAVMAGA